jgi:hypothetical protein
VRGSENRAPFARVRNALEWPEDCEERSEDRAERTKFSMEKSNLSVERTNLSVEKSNQSVESRKISVERMNISVEMFFHSVQKSNICTEMFRRCHKCPGLGDAASKVFCGRGDANATRGVVITRCVEPRDMSDHCPSEDTSGRKLR